jgi:hypothetical protein
MIKIMPINFKIKSSLKIIPVLFVLLSLAFPGSVLAETLYAKSSGTKLQKSESATSSVLGKLRKGAAVSVVKKGKKFYQVKAGSKTGWVFKFKLTSRRPAGGGGSGLSGLGGDRVASSGSGSGSSIRGLSPISEDYAKRKGITQADVAAVKHMESQKISERELDSFLSQGKLREYGE